MIEAVGAIAAHKHFPEVGVLQDRPEGVQALLQNFFPVGNKQQAAGLSGVLFAKALVIQRGNHGFARAGRGDNQVARVAPNGALRLQLIQNLLLVRVGLNIHGVELGIVFVIVFLRLQSTREPFPLPLVVILKFIGVPVTFKRGGDLINGFRQVLFSDLHVPFQAAGDRRARKIGGADIGGGKAGVAVKHIGFRVEAGALGVIADLDLRVGQLAKLFDGFHVGRAHVRGRDDPQLAAVLGEGGQLVHDEAQTAPLDERHQHIDPIAGDDLFFELGVHLRLVNGAGEQAGLRERGLRPDDLRFFVDGPNMILPVKKSKKLLRPLRNRERVEIGFFCFHHNGGDDLIGQRDLSVQIAAVVLEVFQPAFDHLGHILRQHLGRFRRINRRSLTELVRIGKLSIQSFVDYLLIQSIVQHQLPPLLSNIAY